MFSWSHAKVTNSIVNRFPNNDTDIFLKNLKWRADEKMDSILEENWDDIRSVLPHSVNTTDKFGRPCRCILCS